MGPSRIAGAVLVSALLLFGIFRAGPAPRATEAANQATLTIGVGSVAESLDPHLSVGALSVFAQANIFEALTVIQFPGGATEVKPSLAAGWKLVNPTTWEFRLRRDIQFSNGEPFTADVVKFNVERVLDPATKAPIKGRIPTVESVRIVDAETVRIVTKSPDPILPKRMATIYMVPPKYFEQVGEKRFGEKAVGTGAFCVDSYTRLQQLTLVACRKGGRLEPNIQQVKMIQIPDDAGRVAALRSGGVQVIQNVPIDQTDLLKREGFQVNHAVAGRTMMVMLRGQVESPLKDRRVRQALSHAVDAGAIFDGFIRGFGALANGQPIGPDGVGFNPEIKPYRYDVARARDLLAKAGYPNGFATTMSATKGAFVADKDTTQAVQNYFAAVGVTVKDVTVEYGEFLRRTNTGTHEPMFLASYNYFPAMDGDFVLQWFWSKHPVKLGIYPDFDRLLEASRSEMDSRKREDLLRQGEQTLA